MRANAVADAITRATRRRDTGDAVASPRATDGSEARRIVVEREGIKLAIQGKRTVDARMHG